MSSLKPQYISPSDGNHNNQNNGGYYPTSPVFGTWANPYPYMSLAPWATSPHPADHIPVPYSQMAVSPDPRMSPNHVPIPVDNIPMGQNNGNTYYPTHPMHGTYADPYPLSRTVVTTTPWMTPGHVPIPADNMPLGHNN